MDQLAGGYLNLATVGPMSIELFQLINQGEDMDMYKGLKATLQTEEAFDKAVKANEIDLEDVALTEEASKAMLEQLKTSGIEPSRAIMETRAKWTEGGELLLFYTMPKDSSGGQGKTMVMQIPADQWGLDIQQNYLH